MEISDLFCLCGEWDATSRFYNTEAGNYYSKSTFIMTLIKQEKLVFILVILYIREYLCFFTNCLCVPGYPVPKNPPKIHNLTPSGPSFKLEEHKEEIVLEMGVILVETKPTCRLWSEWEIMVLRRGYLLYPYLGYVEQMLRP